MAKWMVAALLGCVLAWAYNPPVDTAGPITVEMQAPAVGTYGAGGYADLSRPDVPFTVPVSVRNSSDREIGGTLRVVVIDRWKVDPATPVPFSVGPRGRWRSEFTVSFGRGTYNAHYPIHAYAEFESGGKKLMAHPVLIVQPKLADQPRPKLPVEWKPVVVPAVASLGLWRMPVRRESAEIVNVGAEAGQAGREVFDAGQVFLYGTRMRRGEGREGIGMTLGKRPPSGRETVESAAVEYPLTLPAGAQLRFAVGGTATFAVKAAPFEGGAWSTLWERKPQGDGWETSTVDLARYAGVPIRLRLEARGSSGEAQWGEPLLTAGAPPRLAEFPPVGEGRLLGKAGECEVRLWKGSRGLLDAPVGLVCGAHRLFFHGLRVRVAGDALEDWRSGSELVTAAEEAAGARYRVRHHFRNWAGSFDVVAELWVEGGALRAAVRLENAPAAKPWFAVFLESVSAGEWSETVERVYAGAGNVLVKPKAFRLGYDGHNLSTSFVGFDFAGGQALVQNSDAIPDALEIDPARRIATLVTPHTQTLEFYPADNVFTAVKRLREADRRQAAAGVAKLAGRFTFDLWGGRYQESARALDRAAEYGLKDALVVWHNWQRWGYDYRLPDIYPPNPQLGTEAEFRALIEACGRAGTLFAPHDNYIDFYPDSEGFSYGNVVFRQNGTPFKAWFNYGREAQSYRARPEKVRPLVERNVGMLASAMAPTAYFIDVWSSASPYDYWTDEGKFVDRSVTQRAWGEAFAWIRQRLGDRAPQISEAGHDKLIGWLDGADAQQLRVDPKGAGFTWKTECADAERIPWIDVAWHDRFVLHGAGYEGRYLGGLDARDHGALSDDYLSVEVLSGRPAMVGQPFGRNVVRVYWLLNAAMRALAGDRIAGVEFGGGDIHRQHVRWEKGGEVWVNRGAEAWNTAGHMLPQYGFYVRAGAAEAAVELRGGRRVEWSRGPEGRYEDGRFTDSTGKVRALPE